LKYKNILFRADSSSQIGTGHIMRDLVLAKQFKNANIIFATIDLPNNINNKISEAGYKVELLNSNDIKEVTNIIQIYNIDLLVIDHYDIDYEYESKIKQNNKISILCIDDLYKKHNCDILLNHNICADESKYKDLVPNSCELRCGSKYTLLRDEFILEKNKFDILLAMGGADSSNMNIKILEIIEDFKNIHTHIVTTNANSNILTLKNYCTNNKQTTLHINTNEMAKLIRNSDFAIITPSVTANEVVFMNKPFIAIKVAKNQEGMYQYLLKQNILVLKKFNKNTLSKYIHKLLKELR